MNEDNGICELILSFISFLVPGIKDELERENKKDKDDE